MAITATSYGLNHDAAFTGMVADGQVANIVSKINDDTATVAYGKGVVRSGEKGFKAATAVSTAGNFVGVLVRELNRSYADGATFGAPIDRPASVLTAGVIWVTVAEDVAVGDAAYLRVGATQTGDFAKAAGSEATLSVAIPGAKFLTAATAGGLAKLSLVVGG
ncbi:virion structural protein [Klebsiella phage JD001]|uniref:Uncharacterized protein n=1 Tax=Klebsiella phage JD001 TaxID=1236000 RepID=L0AQX6_9CAUD|nr:virion structural protein [Klebsiella phage JD001]AFZ77576.1 hypothetical protein [Klebsiella phage JD001]